MYACSCLSKDRKDKDRTGNNESSLWHTYRLPPHKAPSMLADRIVFAMSMYTEYIHECLYYFSTDTWRMVWLLLLC